MSNFIFMATTNYQQQTLDQIEDFFWLHSFKIERFEHYLEVDLKTNDIKFQRVDCKTDLVKVFPGLASKEWIPEFKTEDGREIIEVIVDSFDQFLHFFNSTIGYNKEFKKE